jgi:hypothetical protein
MSRRERRLAEGHAMTDTAKVPRKSEGGKPARRPLVDDELADQLLGKAQAEGAELLDGLLWARERRFRWFGDDEVTRHEAAL